MILVFDGPDNSGKTTIAQELCKRSYLPYFRHNVVTAKNFQSDTLPLINEANEQYVIDLFKVLNEWNVLDLVVDRFYPSDYVYSKVYKRNRSEESLRATDDLFKSIPHASIIICYKTVHQQKEGDWAKSETYAQAAELFREFTKWTRAPVLLLDTTDEDLETQLKVIREFIKAQFV